MDFQNFIREITAPTSSTECLPWIQFKQAEPTTLEKVEHLLHEMEKAKDRGQTNMALYYIYRIGKEIEEEISLKKRRACRQALTIHYRTLMKRVRCLFNDDRVSLIFKCKVLTPTTIRQMSAENYKKLLEAAEEASAFRILGEEINTSLQEDC